MGDVSIPLLKRHLNQAINYLNPFLPYLNAHMTKFFSDNLWQRNVPPNIQNEIRTDVDVHEAINIYRQHLNPDVNSTGDTDRLKNFRAFLRNTKQFYLDSYKDVWITSDDLNRELKLDIGDKAQTSKDLMPQKKRHEVVKRFSGFSRPILTETFVRLIPGRSCFECDSETLFDEQGKWKFVRY